MKKLSLFALLCAPLLVSSAHAAPKPKIAAKAVQWQPSYAAALAEGKRSGKPIFVDFFTTWCGPCKYLDAVTYKDPTFIAQSRHWVMLKVDAEKDTANVKLAGKFRVEGYPTLLFLKSNGNEADRSVGFMPAGALVAQMRKAAEKANGGRRI